MISSFRVATHMTCIACLGLALVSFGCTNTGTKSTPPLERNFGMEQLLRLPIENGREGVDEIVLAMRGLYKVNSGTELSPLTNTPGHTKLADGIVVSQALTTEEGIVMVVADKPCFTIERAVALTGATKAYEGPGDDIRSGLVAYILDNHEVRIEIDAYDPGRNCMDKLSIYKQQRVRPGD